jgi:hypothetical protein
VKRLRELNAYRARDWEKRMGAAGDDNGGCFRVPSPMKGIELSVIASNAEGWDHISVSTPHRCPTWSEMDLVKRLFFRPDEVAMQLHVAESDHISIHTFCLHLWRPHDVAVPLPPAEFV